MVARNIPLQDVNYSQMQQEDGRDFIVEVLKPTGFQTMPPQHTYSPTYFELSNIIDSDQPSTSHHPHGLHQGHHHHYQYQHHHQHPHHNEHQQVDSAFGSHMDTSVSQLLEVPKQQHFDANTLQHIHTHAAHVDHPHQLGHSHPHHQHSAQSQLQHQHHHHQLMRKRKPSCHEITSDDENTEDTRSVKTNDDSKKQNHSEIEKRRRDKMNTYIVELSSMIPMCHIMPRKLDKLTVLRMAVQHLKTIRGSSGSYASGGRKPSLLNDQEMKKIILQAADGFLFVVGCDRGRLLYLSESVTKYLNYSQGDLLGQSLFDILHPKDVAKVKEQLSAANMNPRERLIDAKTILPVKAELSSSEINYRLCPGARRSFFCRMKCKYSSDVKEEADTTTGYHRRKCNKPNGDKKYNVIHCTGYLKSWPPAKMGLEGEDLDVDGCNLACLVAIGRTLPHISSVAMGSTNSQRSASSSVNVQPIKFVSRHALDGKFLYVDQKFLLGRATLVLGFLPQELLGTSMYEYYHHDDIHFIAEHHKSTLQSLTPIQTKVYRFRTKDGGFVKLQSEWRAFRNPWTKEIENVISKNSLIWSDFRMVDSSASKPGGLQSELDFLNSGKEMQQMIKNHVEASKIGRQIVDQVMDITRKETPSLNSPVSQQDTNPCMSHISDGKMSRTKSDIMLDDETFSQTHISTSIRTPQSGEQLAEHDFSSENGSTMETVRENVVLSSLVSDSASALSQTPSTISIHRQSPPSEGIREMMEEAVRNPSTSNGGPSNDDNDEAAMAVLMSLLEADAGLGGPVDFSGLPWPLP